MALQENQNGDAGDVPLPSPTVVFSSVKPQILVVAPKANDAVQFYKDAFNAEEVSRNMYPKRKADQELPLILSVELKIAGFSFIVSDSVDETSSLESNVGNGCVLCLETEDFDSAVAKVVKAGAVALATVSEGACCGGGKVLKVKDPYGFVWLIYTPEKKCSDVEA